MAPLGRNTVKNIAATLRAILYQPSRLTRAPFFDGEAPTYQWAEFISVVGTLISVVNLRRQLGGEVVR